MRDILFRGKRIDNGEWVEGGYIFDSGYPRILTHVKMHNEPIQECYGYEVDASTVGQFTGVRDKNGKRIFEGNIVSYYESLTGKLRNYLVLWNEYSAAYVLKAGKYEFPIHIMAVDELTEVIGNVHENPNLLKV